MKKQIILVLLVALLVLSSACTIQLPAPIVEQADPNDQQAAQNNSNDNQQASNPTPEPTQEFVENDGGATAHAQATPNPNMATHDDMIGLWYLVVWEDVNMDNSDLVFYDITKSMMNVSIHTNTPSYGDFNYTYQNGNVDFGNGAYEVILDNGVLVLMSKSTGKTIVFQPITEAEAKSLAGSSNTDTSSWEIVTPEPAGTTIEIMPTGPSNRTGYPFYDGEITYNVAESELVSELTNKTWRTYGYQWDDGSIVHDFAMYNEFQFNSDYSFNHQTTFGANPGLFEVYGVGLELFYSDGSMQYYREVFIIENQSNGYSYLFMEDPEAGYEGCYTIFEGY